MNFIAEFGYHWFWFGLAGLLLAIEVYHGRFMFLAVSFAAVVMGVLTHFYAYVAFPVQLLFFVVLGGGFMWLTRSYLEDRESRIRRQRMILESRGYLGKVLTLVNPIEGGISTLNLGGMVWTLHGSDCPAGAQVKVVDMGEGWLKVEPL